MSDATNPDAGDFRGTRETKRQDETVMLGQDSLGAMVDEAKALDGASPAAAAPAPAAPVDATGALSGTRLIILATGAIVILLVIVALVYSVVS